MSVWPIQRIRRRAFLVVAILSVDPAAALAQERIAVPDDAAQKQAQELVRQVYGKQFDEAKSSAEKTKLARELLDQAANSKENPANHFVLLRIAKDMAVLADDAETALEAVDRIVDRYEVDGLEMKLACVEKVAGAAKMSSQHKAIAREAFSLIEAAVAEDAFEAARQLGEIARESARKGRDYLLVKHVVTRMKEVDETEKAYAEYLKWEARLEESPTDPEANLAAGRYHCLSKGDWDWGIPMLALGSDPALKGLAVKELTGAASPNAQMALGDGWWDLAQTKEGRERDSFLLRAGHWYEQAEPKMTSGLMKAKLQQRLEEIAKIKPLPAQVARPRPPSEEHPSATAFEMKSGTRFKRQARRGLAVRIFASGCNGHQIYLNGTPLMKCSRDKATTAAATLKEGDALMVKLGDRFDVMNLWMRFQTLEGDYLFETSDKWTAYLPVDSQRWWDIRNIRPGVQKAEYAPDSREYVDLVKKAAQQAVPDYPKAQPIYSPLMGKALYSDAYLYYVVAVEDLLPRKRTVQAASDRRSAPETVDQTPKRPRQTPTPADQMPKPIGKVSTPGLTPDAEGWILLPPLVHASRDTEDAGWKWDGEIAAFSAQKPRARVSFPLQIEGSYELHARVTISKARETTAICLPIVGNRMVVLDMKGDRGNSGSPTATIRLQGVKPPPRPQSNASMNVGTEYAFLCRVVVSQNGVGVEVRRDDQVLFQWAGAVSQIVERRAIRPATVELETAYYSSSRFRDLRFRMLSGKAVPLSSD